jgi:putative endonuclease
VSIVAGACPPSQAELAQALRAGSSVKIMFCTFFYTYVLRSTKDEKLYIGWTNNLRQRLVQHNNGKVDSTMHRRPLKLVYYEACEDRERAVKREKYFKTGFGRRFLKDRI